MLRHLVYRKGVWRGTAEFPRSRATWSFHSNRAAANERPELRTARKGRSAATPHQTDLGLSNILVLMLHHVFGRQRTSLYLRVCLPDLICRALLAQLPTSFHVWSMRTVAKSCTLPQEPGGSSFLSLGIVVWWSSSPFS